MSGQATELVNLGRKLRSTFPSRVQRSNSRTKLCRVSAIVSAHLTDVCTEFRSGPKGAISSRVRG